MARYDIIIIGAGTNGLVAASYLAKAGLKTLVLERRETVGGTAITEQIAPAFKCPILAHSAGPLLSDVVQDLKLENHGLELITPSVQLTALNPKGAAISIHDDVRRTAAGLKEHSQHDSDNYPEFAKSFARIGKVLSPLLRMTPPSIDKPTPTDVWDLSKLGLAFRGLGRTDAFRLLRWGPMAVADLVAEWFETELLRAAIAARGINCSFAGPWSAGSSAGLLWQAALSGSPISPAVFAKGGIGNVTQALAKAATAAGADIRSGSTVENILVHENRATTVVLKNGDELNARAIVSTVDPHTTFLRLVDPLDLEPNFISKIRNYRAIGSAAKVNLALSALPRFVGINDAADQLAGRIHVGPEIDYLERAFDAAKYGDYSPHPYLDITIPTVTDPSLAPDGAHVMSIHVQFAPYKLKQGDWNSRRDEFGDVVVRTLAEYAPNLPGLVVGRQVITPVDLKNTYGLSGGHLMHGEQTLDQFFTFRPLIGWAQYRTPIRGLYMCGAGTHPGGGITGAPGMNGSREILKDLKR